MKFEIRDTMLQKSVLVKYEGTEEKVVVPDGVKVVNGIRNNSSIVELILPDGLEELSYCAIQKCDNLKTISIPDNVFLSRNFVSECPALTTLIFRGEHYKNNPGGTNKCPKCNQVIISEKGMFSEIERRNGGVFWEDFSSRVKFFDHEGNRMLTPKEQKIEKGKDRLSNSSNPLQKEFLAADKWAVKQKLDLSKITSDQNTIDKLQYVLYAYASQMSKDPVYHAASYKKDIVPVVISKEADEIAKGIGKKLLMNAVNVRKPTISIIDTYGDYRSLSEPITRNVKRFEKECDPSGIMSDKVVDLAFILPFCRYASEKEIKKLVSNSEYLMKKLSTHGRKAAIAIRSGLLLSDTKEAITYLKKYNQLKLYAEIRGKTEKEIDDIITSDTGLQNDGSIGFDL